MDEKKVPNIISKHLAGQANEAEEKYLQLWLKESALNRQVYDNIYKLWQLTKPKGDIKTPDTAAEWSALQTRLGITFSKEKAAILPMQKSTIKRSRPILPKKIRWAMASAALVILTFGGLFFNSQNQQVYVTQNAERKTIELPDGSTVHLNVASEIRLAQGLPDSVRRIFLKGQAFFDIARDGRPFEVQTENARIRVLGTRFDIQSRNHETRAIVKEGSILLQTISDTPLNKVILQANEQSLVIRKNAPTPVEQVQADYIIGWLNNRFVFHQTPLREIAAELERRYDTKIHIQSPTLGSRSLSGAFREEEIDTTLHVFCQTLNLKYSFQNDSYLIYE